MTHIELNEASKQKGRSTSNAKIISETPSFQQSIQANKDKEGSQILNEKLKLGKRLRQQHILPGYSDELQEEF